MKHLTGAWAKGDLNGAEEAAALAHAKVQRIAMLPTLPPRFRDYGAKVAIQGSRIREAVFDTTYSYLHLALRCPDVGQSFTDLNLTYTLVQVESVNVPLLRSIVEDAASRAWYDELDHTVDGLLEHRWLFLPEQEWTIVFREFEYHVFPAPSDSSALETPRLVVRDGPPLEG